tara:strand:+ start:703 stop:909 length:207 start_codon:yes stop_codon:yes gene_type:complete
MSGNRRRTDHCKLKVIMIIWNKVKGSREFLEGRNNILAAKMALIAAIIMKYSRGLTYVSGLKAKDHKL